MAADAEEVGAEAGGFACFGEPPITNVALHLGQRTVVPICSASTRSRLPHFGHCGLFFDLLGSLCIALSSRRGVTSGSAEQPQPAGQEAPDFTRHDDAGRGKRDNPDPAKHGMPQAVVPTRSMIPRPGRFCPASKPAMR